MEMEAVARSWGFPGARDRYSSRQSAVRREYAPPCAGVRQIDNLFTISSARTHEHARTLAHGRHIRGVPKPFERRKSRSTRRCTVYTSLSAAELVNSVKYCKFRGLTGLVLLIRNRLILPNKKQRKLLELHALVLKFRNEVEMKYEMKLIRLISKKLVYIFFDLFERIYYNL